MKSERRKLSFERWVAKSIEMFGEIFDFTQAQNEYGNYQEPKVTIKCTLHDYEFLLAPRNHLRRPFGGCEGCERENAGTSAAEYQMYWKDKPCDGKIYVLTSKTEGKKYVGLTRRPIETRLNGHKKRAEKNTGTKGSLQEAINKFGMDDFSVKIIDTAKTLGELSEKEKHFIEHFETLRPTGYNDNRGGSVARGIDPFNFEGQTYWGLADLADDYSIHEETLRKRVEAGWTLRQGVELDARPLSKLEGETWTVGNKKFISTQELCDHFGLITATFKARLKSGWSLEEAVGLEELPREKIIYKGDTFDSIAEVSETYGQNVSRVHSRLKAGLTLEQALDPIENPARFGKKGISIDGRYFESHTAAAAHYQISSAKLTRRLIFLNSDKTTAQFKELEKKKHAVRNRDLTVEGTTYPTFKKLSEAYGVNKDTIRGRLNAGKTLREAVGLTKLKETIFPLEFKGRVFNSQKQIANHYKIKRATFGYRLNKAGWSLEEALGLDERTDTVNKVIIRGKECASKLAAARHYKIDKMVFNGRLDRQWSLEEALELKPRIKSKVKRKIYVVICPDGNEIMVSNLTKFSNDKGWRSDRNLRETLSSDKHHTYHGYSLRWPTNLETEQFLKENPDALTPNLGYKRNQPIKYKGQTYKSKAEFCRAFNLKETTFHRAFKKLKSVDKVIAKLVKGDA